MHLHYCQISMTREELVSELMTVAETMVQGNLLYTPRTCGKPGCACHRDPSRRHGPSLYFTWTEDNKSRSLFVPAERFDEAKAAQDAWSRFREIGSELATLNRKELKERWAKKKRKPSASKSSKLVKSHSA